MTDLIRHHEDVDLLNLDDSTEPLVDTLCPLPLSTGNQMATRLAVVVGGQYGSEGKGHVAGYLCREEEFGEGLAIRVAGPNAGHSVVHPVSGVKIALRQIPVAAVTNPGATLAIAAGSEINLDVLNEEIELLRKHGIEVTNRLVIDPAATLLEQVHIDREHLSGIVGRIGSTGKGIGTARSDRIMRVAATAGREAYSLARDGILVAPVAELAVRYAQEQRPVLVEGTQGYGLGLHTPYYPKVTSSDCRAIDFLSMAGISPWQECWQGELTVWVCIRPYPIRVAGDSGPMAGETTWDELGLPPEYTTVTKKMRRVGHWDTELVRAAVAANGGVGDDEAVQIAVTMIDQVDPEMAGVTDPAKLTAKTNQYLDELAEQIGAHAVMVTTSASTVVDFREGPLFPGETGWVDKYAADPS